MNFRIAQCLCPQRHQIFVMLFNDPGLSDGDILEALQTAIARAIHGEARANAIEGRIEAWCSRCGSPEEQWIYEVRKIHPTSSDVFGASYEARKARWN